MDSAARLIVVVVFDGVDLLDVTGPPEVFALAARESERARDYRVVLAARALDPITTSAGVRIVPDRSFDELIGAPIDTLIVPGAVERRVDGTATPVIDPALVAAVDSLADRAHRVTSVCVGAHILAATGRLDGRRATTHWSTADRLAADHPDVIVDPDPIYVRDGDIWTAAGISSCLDLALALVAEDLGEDVALRVARQLVMYLKRPGGQSQFSVPLMARAPSRRIETLRHHILEHIGEKLGAVELAAAAHVGERQLARWFRSELGTTPHEYVEALRVEVARRALESHDRTIEKIAADAGFGSADTMGRAFIRKLGVSPSDYRKRFRLPG